MALEKAYLNSISTKDKEDYHIKFVDYGFDMYSVKEEFRGKLNEKRTSEVDMHIIVDMCSCKLSFRCFECTGGKRGGAADGKRASDALERQA